MVQHTPPHLPAKGQVAARELQHLAHARLVRRRLPLAATAAARHGGGWPPRPGCSGRLCRACQQPSPAPQLAAGDALTAKGLHGGLRGSPQRLSALHSMLMTAAPCEPIMGCPASRRHLAAAATSPPPPGASPPRLPSRLYMFTREASQDG